MKTPPELDRIVDVVLAYRPKPKTKATRKREQLKASKTGEVTPKKRDVDRPSAG